MTTDPAGAQTFYTKVLGWGLQTWTASVDAVKAHGGQVLHGPAEVPGGDWIAQCLDPQGAAFALHQRKG